jgi:hypothetical protein
MVDSDSKTTTDEERKNARCRSENNKRPSLLIIAGDNAVVVTKALLTPSYCHPQQRAVQNPDPIIPSAHNNTLRPTARAAAATKR